MFRRLRGEDPEGAGYLRAMELKAQELNHKAEIIERKERRELAALLNRHLTIASCSENCLILFQLRFLKSFERTDITSSFYSDKTIEPQSKTNFNLIRLLLVKIRTCKEIFSKCVQYNLAR